MNLEEKKTLSGKNLIRVMYVNGGGANLIVAHRNWESDKDESLQVSRTFSGQIAQFCAKNQLPCLMVSTNKEGDYYQGGLFRIVHVRKSAASGWRFHYREVSHFISVLKECRLFRANVLLVDSGVTHFFLLFIMRVFGIKVVPILHNSLWPRGFPPQKLSGRALLKLNGLFWRHVPDATLVVSPAIKQQICEISPKHRGRIIEFRAQFDRARFSRIAPPPSLEENSFTVMFVGRAARSKGVVDLAKIAAAVESKLPGQLRWVVCGDGPDLKALRQQISALHVEPLFEIKGHLDPEDLIAQYDAVHAVIVPTRSNFPEGLAMTAIEPVLAGRPVITNSVVPALDLIRPACVQAKTDDCMSYADAVIKLVTDKELYDKLQTSCARLAKDFTDARFGLAQALEQALFPSY